MKKAALILFGVFLSLSSSVSAQEETFLIPRLKLGIEAGTTAIFNAATNKPINIRENQSYYYNYYDNDYYSGFVADGQGYNLFYFGLKPEYTVTKRMAVAAGVRFTFNNSTLNSDRNYFLWKTAEDGLNTDYVRIRDISQRNIFVGVPLEIKLFPREIDYFVRHYFIVGTALNFLVSSKNDISYQNSRMEKYNSLISEQIGKPNNFQGYLYAGFGLKIGRTNHPFGNIEFQFPIYVFDNKRLSSFARTDNSFGIGVQTTLQIPLFKNHKLEYTVNND
ncbi:MAG: hypothetical protein LBN27_04985 [Prevotellaceae bacterium]|jgi:hypothetical protein|nr:hypothetical protein [Prevotellaceae bacterium]